MGSPFGIDSGVIVDLFGPILFKMIGLNEKKKGKKNNPENNRKDYSAERWEVSTFITFGIFFFPANSRNCV
jgi:hypothetical protein